MAILMPRSRGVSDDRRPDAGELLQVLRRRSCSGPRRRRCRRSRPPAARAASITCLQMRDDLVAVSLIGMERVRVVAERRDLQPVVGEQRVDLSAPGRVERGDVDVADAAVAAVLLADRPAGDLEHPEAALGRPGTSSARPIPGSAAVINPSFIFSSLPSPHHPITLSPVTRTAPAGTPTPPSPDRPASPPAGARSPRRGRWSGCPA